MRTGAADRIGRLARIKLLLARSPSTYRWSRFALNVLRFVVRRPHESDFAAFKQFPHRPGIFLDIGANTGQSAFAFRIFDRRTPILSVEANALHEPELRIVGRLLPRFGYLICAAGEQPGSATLHVPVFRGLPLTGEASLDPDAEHLRHPWWVEQAVGRDHEPLDVIRVPVEIRRLDDLELEPAYVKIDVEGAEPQVLRGLSRTLERHRPILLVEDASSHGEVSALLGGLGYEPFEWDPSERRLRPPVDGSARNLFYVPRDSRPETSRAMP